jgi:hypothetical protein
MKATQDWLAKWVNRLALSDCDIIPKFKPDSNFNQYDTPVVAITEPDTSYRRATVTFYKPFFSLNQHDQERTVLHELVHVMLAEEQSILFEMTGLPFINPTGITGPAEKTTARIERLLWWIFEEQTKPGSAPASSPIPTPKPEEVK